MLPFAAALGLLVPQLGLGDDADTAVTQSTPPQTPPPDPPAATEPSRTTPRRVIHLARSRNVYAGILPGHLSPAVRGVPERVYVPNSDSGTVTEINPVTFAVVRTFPTGSYDQHITP